MCFSEGLALDAVIILSCKHAFCCSCMLQLVQQGVADASKYVFNKNVLSVLTDASCGAVLLWPGPCTMCALKTAVVRSSKREKSGLHSDLRMLQSLQSMFMRTLFYCLWCR